MCFLLLLVSLKFVAALRPNIILVLTDDQDLLLNSLNAMPFVRKNIANEGITFQNMFVNSPICCPSRSTLLSGQYMHNTNVKNNSLEGNCCGSHWQRVHEPFTFPNRLKLSGYLTFYAGKYLNQYGFRKSGGLGHVPAGYDWWMGLKGNSRYYNYTLSLNGTRFESDDYLTDLMKKYALSFLNGKDVENGPFFMMLSTPAPHAPFTPAPRHTKAFEGVKALRTPAFNATAKNKHWLLRMPPTHLPQNVDILDQIQRKRFQTLLAVDELLEEIVAKLRRSNILQRTYIILTSDNGYHIGQFVQPWDKRQPYETDIRVPFVIRGPNLPKKHVFTAPTSIVDIAPTILQMAGVDGAHFFDGQPFLDAMRVTSEKPKISNILVEYHGEGGKRNGNGCPWSYDENLAECSKDSWCKCQDVKNNTYNCLRRFSPGENVKFCRFFDNENFTEVYDLSKDPYELENLENSINSTYFEFLKDILRKLVVCKGSNCYDF